MTGHVRWGVLGASKFAREQMAPAIHRAGGGKLAALATSTMEKAESFQEINPDINVHLAYDALLADPEIDAVYIAVPHTGHAEWAIKAAEAGKHVLVEKPMTPTAAETATLFAAAERAGVFMGEAYMYRLHPTTQKLVDLIRAGTIGEVRLIRSNFGYNKGAVDPHHRLFDPHLAGGGILDIGGYPVSMALLIAGAAAGMDYLEPVSVTGSAQIGASGVDEWASAVLGFDNGILAELSCSIRVTQDNMLSIMGSRGRLTMRDFWFAGGKEGGTATIFVYDNAGDETIIPVHDDGWLYAYEADAVHAAIAAGRLSFVAPGMSAIESVANMRVMDRWRAAIGLQYPFE